jgi:hypothetical protein
MSSNGTWVGRERLPAGGYRSFEANTVVTVFPYELTFVEVPVELGPPTSRGSEHITHVFRTRHDIALPELSSAAPPQNRNIDARTANLLATLKAARTIENHQVGYVAQRSETYHAAAALRGSCDELAPELLALVFEAEPAGRLYAAALLATVDPLAGRAALEWLTGDPSPTSWISADSVVSSSVAEEARVLLTLDHPIRSLLFEK